MRPFLLPALFLLVLAGGCEKEQTDRSFGNPDSARKVLIAGSDSVFKQEVIGRIGGMLGTDGFSVRVTGQSALSKIEAKDYQAIILVSSLQAGKVGKEIADFIRSQRSDPKIILFYTRGSEAESPGWAKPDLGVDTVTSASKNERVEERAKQLVDLIKKRIGR